jgi:hypothetical protein
MSVSESDRARIVRLLLVDVESTVGRGYEAVVRDSDLIADEFADEVARYRDLLVEDVQQYFHDCFVDTTWPSCPRHPNHPLWLHDGFWHCERDGVAIAKLGALGPRYTLRP